MKSIGSKGFTIHLDLLTDKKTPIRYTLSTLYPTFKSTGSVLRIPMQQMTKWTVIALDMPQLLKLHTSNNYSRESYGLLKGIRLCSSMSVKGVYTSDTPYEPSTLPKPLAFYIPSSEKPWDSFYDWKWFPSPPDDTDIVTDVFEPDVEEYVTNHVIGKGKRHFQAKSILSDNFEQVSVQRSLVTNQSLDEDEVA